MLRKKAINKILITTTVLFVVFSVYLIPNIKTKKTIKTNLELQYVSGVGDNSIYLLDKNNYLVKARILLTSKDKKKNIETLINTLTIGNGDSFSESLKGTIPEGTRLLDVSIDSDIVVLNFSKKLISVSRDLEVRMIESIVYSVTSLNNINGVKIQVNGENLGNLPNSKANLPEILNKDIGINKEYDLKMRKDIDKTVIYYVEKIDDMSFYVPVTKYTNDSRDKVKIIIDKLSSDYIYEPNLISLLNKDVEVKKIEEQDKVMKIDFNNSIFNKNNKVSEEVIYTISYSIFDNYNVESVIYTVDDKELKTVNSSDLY